METRSFITRVAGELGFSLIRRYRKPAVSGYTGYEVTA
jgi:hypothetical protein